MRRKLCKAQGWAAGHGGTSSNDFGSNSGYPQEASTTAQDLSNTAAGKLKAKITTVCSSNGLTVTQVVTMNEDDQYFTNTVTLQNTGATALSDVRFTFWVDPDNTKDMDGDYTTKNTVVQVAFCLSPRSTFLVFNVGNYFPDSRLLPPGILRRS